MSENNNIPYAVIYPTDTKAAEVLIHRLLSAGWFVTGIQRAPTGDESLKNFINLEGTKQSRLCILPRTNYLDIKQALLRANAVVYFTVGSIQDTTNALRLLSQVTYEIPKTFILVSNALTWSESKTLRRHSEDLKGLEGDAEPLTEDQFHRRVPHAKYLAWKEVEKLCRSTSRKNLETYVVVSGLLYGCGEDLLLPLFKIAWHQDTKGLPVFGRGNQRIPMIHMYDLSSFILKLVSMKSDEHLEQRYIFAIDEGKETYQSIINAIGHALGNPRSYIVPERDLVLIEGIEHLIINVNFEQGSISTLLTDEEEATENKDDGEEDPVDASSSVPRVSYKWHMRAGFSEQIHRVCEEFRYYQGVEPLRIILSGPPGCTRYAKELASWYKIPHFTLRSIIDSFLKQQSLLKEEMEVKKLQCITSRRNTKLAEKKETKLQAWREEHAKMLMQKKNARSDEDDEENADARSYRDDMGDADAEDEDDEENEDDLELDGIELDEAEEKEIIEAFEAEDLERIETDFATRVDEINKILNMRVRSQAEPEPVSSKKGKAGGKDAKQAQGSATTDAKTNDLGDGSSTHPDGSNVRFTEEAIALMARWVLSRPNCVNSGYVLEGYPWNMQQANLLFAGSGGEPETPDANHVSSSSVVDTSDAGGVHKKMCDVRFFPTHYIQCLASDPQVQSHLASLSQLEVEEESARHQAAPGQMKSSVDIFRKHLERFLANRNDLHAWFASARCKIPTKRGRIPSGSTSAPDPSVSHRMLTVQQVEITLEDASADASAQSTTHAAPTTWAAKTLELTKWIGPARNFGPTPEEIAEEKEQIRRWQEEKQRLERERLQKKEEREKAEQAEITMRRKKDEENLHATQVYEREMLETRKEPLRQYLLESVIPVLTKGLIDLCETKPEDPVDALAEWLFRYNPN